MFQHDTTSTADTLYTTYRRKLWNQFMLFVIWNKHNFALNDRNVVFFNMVDFTTAIIFQYVYFIPQKAKKQPPLIIEHEKRLRHISLEIHVVAWDGHTNGVGLNQLTGSQPFHLDNKYLNSK
jgi:hypothetical protein